MKKFFLTPFLCCFLFASFTYGDNLLSCEQYFRADSVDDFANLEESRHRSLRIVTINTQGLKIDDDHDSTQVDRVDHLAGAILDIHPDITVLQEVYSDYELKYLNENYLNDEFEYFFLPGNDGSGHVAFLVKRNLKIEWEYRTHKDRTWQDSTRNGSEELLFSRDAPVLIARDADTGQAFTAIIGHHAKAKRDRRGDRSSNVLRTKQNNEIVKIAKELEAELGAGLPILAAGDFNADLHVDPSTEGLIQSMTDVFDLLARPPPKKRRVTFSYFSKKVHQQNQLDAIVVLNSGQIKVRRADVYRYRDHEGNEHPLPESHRERKTLPSDHNPVWVDIMIPIPKDGASPLDEN